MALKKLFCTFFIIFLFVISYRYCLQGGTTLVNNYIEAEFGYNSKAYSSYNSTIENVFGMKRFEEVDSTSSNSIRRVFLRQPSFRTFVVDDFGAKADGTDDTEAFEETWKAACSSTKVAVLVVPHNTYRIKPIRFSGPCKSNLTVQIYGTIEASDDRSDYKDSGNHWLNFDRVQNLIFEGDGTIDGKGKIWWKNSCKVNKDLPCKDAPTALTFHECKNLVVRNVNIQNAQQIHVAIGNSNKVIVSNLVVTSPEKSPNTDGIHVSGTRNIRMKNCVIGTGDDCISIVSGSHNVLATNITCGPGHGISIGSLGKGHSAAYVSLITVDGAKLSGTANGVRIKTWQGGHGSASKIKFQNIEMHNVTNPIIINQNYCDRKKPCQEQNSAVQVTDVEYKNIKGTSASEVAVKFDCSNDYPCQGISLQDINLGKKRGEAAKAVCNNVELSELDDVSPICYEEIEKEKAK